MFAGTQQTFLPQGHAATWGCGSNICEQKLLLGAGGGGWGQAQVRPLAGRALAASPKAGSSSGSGA